MALLTKLAFGHGYEATFLLPMFRGRYFCSLFTLFMRPGFSTLFSFGIVSNCVNNHDVLCVKLPPNANNADLLNVELRMD